MSSTNEALTEHLKTGVVATCIHRATCKHKLSLQEAAELVHDKEPVWLHLQVGDRAEAADFLHKLGFHELAIEDALSPNERPALTDFDDYIFLVVPAIASDHGEETFVEIGFFLSHNYLVSVADAHSPIIETWIQRWSKHPMKQALATSDMLHVIVDAIVDEYLPIIDHIEDEVDTIADGIFKGERGNMVELLKVKRRLLEMRRKIGPLRDVINGLLRRDLDVVSDATRPYFQDVYDHAARVAESVDLQRDTLTSLLDVHLSVVSNNLNEVMKKMTVIATVLMTAALIAGIYGMNFDHMPELHWAFGYPFALLLMAFCSVGILFLFRWKRWI